jgi:hypothetical protein
MGGRKKNGERGERGEREPQRETRVTRLEEAFLRLEQVQRDTSERLARIEDTLRLSSRLFELMNGRLQKLEEGQQALVQGQEAVVQGQERMVDGQQQVVERLDRLVEGSSRDRNLELERILRLEQRVDALERNGRYDLTKAIHRGTSGERDT